MLSNDEVITSTASGAWLINPGAPFALSVSGVERETAAALRRLLEGSLDERPECSYAAVAAFISEHGVRVDQVERYFAENGPAFRDELRRLTQDDEPDVEVRREA